MWIWCEDAMIVHSACKYTYERARSIHWFNGQFTYFCIDVAHSLSFFLCIFPAFESATAVTTMKWNWIFFFAGRRHVRSSKKVGRTRYFNRAENHFSGGGGKNDDVTVECCTLELDGASKILIHTHTHTHPNNHWMNEVWNAQCVIALLRVLVCGWKKKRSTSNSTTQSARQQHAHEMS